MATGRGLRGWTDGRARGYKQGWADGRTGRRASRRSKSSQTSLLLLLLLLNVAMTIAVAMGFLAFCQTLVLTRCRPNGT